MGYYLAGFDVVGVDHEPQPHYPFACHQADALAFLAEHGQEFDAIHASPPCQAYSVLNRINRGTYPDLIAATRRALIASGRPYVIENVPQAPLHDPVLLCGATFGLRLYRHRAFESSVPLTSPPHDRHVVRCAPLGHVPAADQYMSITGGHRSRAWQRTAGTVMGVPWATTAYEVSQAIPPAYTRFIGEQLREEARPEATSAA
jgi:DNA (cytosine-5)-methyltransferase 1